MPGKRNRKRKKDLKASGNDKIIDIREERRSREKSRKEEAAAAKRKKRNSSQAVSKMIASIVGIILLLILLSSVNNLVDLKQREHEAQLEVANLQAQKTEMEKRAEDAETDEYIEQQARTWLKMARKGDMIYIMNGDPLLQDSGITQEQEEAAAKRRQSDSDKNL